MSVCVEVAVDVWVGVGVVVAVRVGRGVEVGVENKGVAQPARHTLEIIKIMKEHWIGVFIVSPLAAM